MHRKVVLVLAMIIVMIFPTVTMAKLAPGDFIDIKSHWAEQGIQAAFNLGLMKGTGVTSQGFKVFAPEGAVTRAQAASVLVRTFKLDYGKIRFIKQPMASDYYRDINNQAWYAGDIVLCAINQIFSNTEGRDFYPEAPITRMELATAIYRCFNAKEVYIPMIMMMPNYPDLQGFSSQDMSVVAFVNNTGIMKGDGKLFRPDSIVTRGELAVILVRCNSTLALNESNKPSQPPAGISINRLLDVNHTTNLDIDLNIPQTEGMTNPRMQSLINDQFSQDAMKFKSQVASGLDEYVKNAQINNFPVNAFAAFSRFKVGYLDNKLLSLYVDYYQYTGGAHGITERRPYNWDIEEGQQLVLKDIFQTDYDYQLVINKYIRQQINADPEIYFTGNLGFQGIKPNQDFYLEPGNLVIYFQPYAIAPYASGIPEFKIPFSAFKNGLLLVP